MLRKMPSCSAWLRECLYTKVMITLTSSTKRTLPMLTPYCNIKGTLR